MMSYDETVFSMLCNDILPPKLLFCRSKTFNRRSVGKILASNTYIIPFTKRIDRLKFACSFNDGFNTPMNNASRFFLRWSFIGSLHEILYSN